MDLDFSWLVSSFPTQSFEDMSKIPSRNMEKSKKLKFRKNNIQLVE